MDRSVTVSVKGVLVAGVVLLALVVAYLLGGAGDDAAAAPTPAPAEVGPETARTVTMNGSGESSAVPDQVTFDLTVRKVRPELEDALDESSRTMQRVLTALEKQGVARKDVQTTGLEMEAVYDYPQYAPPVLKGYRVTQRAAVLVTELKRAGTAVKAAVATGGNAVRVGDIALKIGDPESSLAKARALAVEEATRKAEEYAEATGQDLGAVMTLREVEDEVGRDQLEEELLYRSADSATASLAALPIRAGRADLTVDVQVVWELAG